MSLEQITNYTADYFENLKHINDSSNNTKNITNEEAQAIYERFGCDINNVRLAANFDAEDELYTINSCFIINGGEGQGEDYEEISRIIEKDNKNGTSNIYFVSFSSYYDSWNGNNYDDASWRVVKPTKRITIDFIA